MVVDDHLRNLLGVPGLERKIEPGTEVVYPLSESLAGWYIDEPTGEGLGVPGREFCRD